jgi:hypothetical protein
MKDYIIEMHKFALEKMDTGVSYDEMVEHLKHKKFDVDSLVDGIGRAYGDIFFSVVEGVTRTLAFKQPGTVNQRHRMAAEAYFRYIGYLEYKAANKNALVAQENGNTAIRYAKWALIISILVGIAQIYVQVRYR